MPRYEIIASWKDNQEQAARTMSFTVVAEDAAEAEAKGLALVEGTWGSAGKNAISSTKTDWGKDRPGKSTTLEIKELKD